MSAHVQACIAAVDAAGWTGRAAQRLVIDPRAATTAGFNALLAEANEIKTLGKFAKASLIDAGYQDVEGWAEEIVAMGASIKDFREDIMVSLAEADVHTSTVRPAQASSSDPFTARRQQVKNLTKKP